MTTLNKWYRFFFFVISEMQQYNSSY